MSRILVIRAGAVGDFVLTLPVFEALKRQFPNTKIDVMGYPSIVALATAGGYASHALSIDRSDLAPMFAEGSVLSNAIRDLFEPYDLVVSFLPDKDGVFRQNLLAAGVRAVWSHPPKPPEGRRRHITCHLYDALTPFSTISPCPPPKLSVSNVLCQRMEKTYGLSEGRQFIAIHPGSGGVQKLWHPPGFAALCDRLSNAGYIVLMTQGPADEDVVAKVLAHVETRPVLVADLSLAELAGILTRCSAMIGADTGITHLAAASGIPTIALFGPTDPAVWGPRGQQVKVLWGTELITTDVAAINWAGLSEVRPIEAISVEAVLDAISRETYSEMI